jgi:hypothetical protein
MCCEELKKILGGNDECYSISTVASEKGREFRLNLTAGKSACKVHVDGCLIADNTTTKCDYILQVCPENELFLVELKGTDVDHAVEQILTTHTLLKQKIKEYNARKKTEKNIEISDITGHIISSSIPRAAEQKFKNLKERALKNNKLNIVKHSFKCELSI